MFSTICLRLEGKVPPSPGIELGSEMSQVSKVNECIWQSAPLPAHDAMPNKETCEFQFQMDIWNLQMEKIRKRYFLPDVRFELVNVTPWKRPPKSSKKKCSFLDYIQFLMIGWVMKVDRNVIKGPQSHQKIKCSFLDYGHFLMIGQVIWAMKVDWNATKGPLSHQKWNVCFWVSHFLMISCSIMLHVK